MTATIPTHEPDSIRAGDTWQWRREDLANDYPATSWTLSYVFKNASKGFGFSATPDGAFFAISVPAAQTDDIPAGIYRWAAQVVNGAERHTISIGTTEILANVFENPDTASDTRSHERKVLDALRAMMEGKATRDQLEYEINGRRLTRLKPAEVIQWIEFYEAKVASQEDAEKPFGKRRGRNSYVSFSRAV